MNGWMIIFKDGTNRQIEADVFQPMGAMIAFYQLSPVSGPSGEQGGKPVFLVNTSEVRSIEPKAIGGIVRTGPRLVGE